MLEDEDGEQDATTLNSTMVRFIFIKPICDDLIASIFKFHYGKIHIQAEIVVIEGTGDFKFHYGKIHIELYVIYAMELSTLNSTMVRFIFARLDHISLHNLTLNSTMVRFIS